MSKTKTFILFSRTEGRLYAQIQLVVKRSGAFGSKGNINMIDYRKKPSYRAHKAKTNAKARGLGFHRIGLTHPFCQFHHINQNDVVSCPEYIHKNIPHCLEDGSALKLEGVLG